MKAGRFALTVVALATSGLLTSPSWALGLGRLSVQSALGESLRAEIDVTNLTPEEAASLQLKIASPDAFRAAGVDYNSVLPSAQVTLQRRADGRNVLRLTSDRAVTEPFLDVILEANWAAGRLVRAYTLLLDPPGMKPATPVMATAPAVAPVAAPAPARPAMAVPAPTAAPAPRMAAAPAPVAAPAPMPSAQPAGPAAARPDRYRVRSGDTLSRIAGREVSGGVSLDQMLVALFRANPSAFIASNMNRLLAGAVLEVPSEAAATQVGAAEARQVIVAQSADFAAYRQRLAGNVGAAGTEAPARQAAGKVQAMVEDRKAGAATPPDKLTLSQDTKVPAPDARTTKEAEVKDAASRVTELARNVEELKRLQSGAAQAPAGTPAPAPAPEVVASAPAPALAIASEAAPVVAQATPTPPPSKPAGTAEEPGMVASLLDNPLVLPGAGVLVALLVGLGLYQLRGRWRRPGGETSFLESRGQPDSFFGASGGQRIDTREGASSSSSSSMSYSLSQLDAIGDVDPVAEADVYLAYGRDLQAEEILKEAMRATPDRHSIRLKLLEVYAKRRDTKGLEMLATQMYVMTNGRGDDWAKAQEIGLSVDSDNPLYQLGGAPAASLMEGGQLVEPLGASTQPHSVKAASSMQTDPPASKLDLGLDLNLDLDSPTEGTPSVDFDLDAAAERPLSPTERTQPLGTDVGITEDSLSFELPDPTDKSSRGSLDVDMPAEAASTDLDSLDFDLGEIDEPAASRPAALDAEPSSPPTGRASDFGALGGSPLERKLELADEFRQIGDIEGARDLLEEVIAKADGALKAKAQGMLDRLA